MKRRLAVLTLGAVCCLLASLAQAAESDVKKADKPAPLKHTMKDMSGEDVTLDKFKGKVVLMVNVASKCGLTDSNYKGLQEIYAKYKDKGLVVLGFPCNQFGGQEPGTSKEISEFCSNEYGVSFDLFEKVKVNGEGACELYKELTAMELKPAGKGKISWNFEKFLIDRDGKAVARFNPRVKPTSKEVIKQIEDLLGKKAS